MRKLLLELVLLLLVLLFVRGGMQELAQSGKPPCLAELQTQAPRDSNFGQRALKAWSAQWSSWLGAPQAAREVTPAQLVDTAGTRNGRSSFANMCHWESTSAAVNGKATAQVSANVQASAQVSGQAEASCSPQALAQHQRELNLSENLANFFTALVLTAWLSLQMAKTPGYWTRPLLLSLATWTFWFSYSDTWPLRSNLEWSATPGSITVALGWTALAYALSFVVMLLVNGLRGWLGRIVAWPWAQTASVHSKRETASMWLFPALCLFLGLGCIWLLDLFAHGCANYWRLGSARTHVMVDVAYGLFVLTTVASVAPLITKAMLRGLNWFDLRVLSFDPAARYARSKAWVLGGGALLGWVVVAMALKPLGMPAALAEWLRLPLWLGVAWLMYRHADKGKLQAMQATRWGYVAVWLVAMLGVTLVLETGQALLNLGLLALIAGALAQPLYDRTPVLKLFHPQYQRVAVIAALLTLLWCGLIYVAPHLPGSFSRIRLRVHALDNPFETFDSYLAMLRWLGAQADLWGFGVGKVPWCGNYSAVLQDCIGGVPYQMPSDYSYYGLIAVWGSLGAFGILVLMLLWLFNFLVSAQPTPEQEQLSGVSPQLFLSWVLGVFATGLMLQIFLTVTGSMGSFPLTGVTLPWVAWGKTQMLAAGFFVGLGLITLGKTQTAPLSPRAASKSPAK